MLVLNPTNDVDAYEGLLFNPEVQPAAIVGVCLPDIVHLTSILNRSVNIVLQFHSGGYVINTPRDPLVQYGPGQLCAKNLASAALCPAYRLASNPQCSYPAQLQDAITAYCYLINTLQISAERIIVSGDSAGAHLSILMLRHLMRTGLPLPQALLLHSPWLDLTPEAISIGNRQTVDYLPESTLRWGVATYKPSGVPANEEFISPGLHPFKSPMPIWVQAGTAEVLYPTITNWVQKMKEKGSLIKLHDNQDMPQNIFQMGDIMGVTDGASLGLEAANKFLEEVSTNKSTLHLKGNRFRRFPNPN